MILRNGPLIRAFKATLALAFLPAAWSQTSAVITADDGSTYNVAANFDKALRPGPFQNNSGGGGVLPVGQFNPSGGLVFYTANYTSFGRANPFNIVGTDPSLGANTTTVPVVIVPIKLTFPNSVVLDGTNQVPAVVNSPIFQTADFTTGGVDIGVTQFGDAIQRAEFWNLAGFSPNYHVLLDAPTVAPTVSLVVPTSGCPASSNNPGGACGSTIGTRIGIASSAFLDAQINSMVRLFSANVLPIFLTDNVFESFDGTAGPGSGCCILGYHNSEGPPIATAHTFIYAAYTRSGTFQGNVILDVQSLSHEVAEWLNDPFVGVFMAGGINLIPPAILPGTGGACIPNFETGDPLEAPPVVFTEVTNSVTYHLQDEVFLWWYLHGTSFGVSGFWTYLGTFAQPSTLCGPG